MSTVGQRTNENSARLLLIDYGLSETTIEGICFGLDQLFSLVKSSIVSTSLPIFALLVNGQNQSEIFLSFSSSNEIHGDLQIALCKLKLLGEKWASKSIRNGRLTSSWIPPLKLIEKLLKTISNRFVQIIFITDRLNETNLNEIRQKTFDVDRFELIVVEKSVGERSNSNIDFVNVRFLPENKFSIGLYFKSWLVENQDEDEDLQLFIRKNDKNSSDDELRHLIRCDLQELFLNPENDAFFITHRSIRKCSTISRLKAVKFIGENRCCISLIFGNPLLVTATKSRRNFDENNSNAFGTLVEFLREKNFSLICRFDENFSGHFLLSVGFGQSLVLRSICSSELLLPMPKIPTAKQQIDPNLMSSLAKIDVENDEFNPLLFEARRTRPNFETNL